MNIGETPPIKPDAAALAVAISNLGKSQVKHGQAVVARVDATAAWQAATAAEEKAKEKVTDAQREVSRIMSAMKPSEPASSNVFDEFLSQAVPAMKRAYQPRKEAL